MEQRAMEERALEEDRRKQREYEEQQRREWQVMTFREQRILKNNKITQQRQRDQAEQLALQEEQRKLELEADRKRRLAEEISMETDEAASISFFNICYSAAVGGRAEIDKSDKGENSCPECSDNNPFNVIVQYCCQRQCCRTLVSVLFT